MREVMLLSGAAGVNPALSARHAECYNRAMQADPRIGTDLAGHRIEAVIGRGPMAVVYLARHLRLGRRVALKVLDPALANDEAFRERFIHESRIAAGIEHPNIVTVYDAGEVDGLLYVSMRYVEGTDLERLLESRGRLRPEVASLIVSQAAAALDAAHAEGLIHGGVRPAVILLERGPGAAGRVFLSDFGIAQHVSSGTRLTRTGSFAGTVDYVAPEQIRGESEIDERADVYALGCVLYRSLVGEPPFPRESELVTIFAHLNDPPPSPSEHRPGLPAAIDEVLQRALAKSREDRFATCEELASATRQALTAAPVAVEVPPEAEVTAPGRGAWHVRAAGLAAVGLVLVLTGIWLVGSRGDGTPSPSPTQPGSPSPVPPVRHRKIVIAAAGEIACAQDPYSVTNDPNQCRYDSTSKLLDLSKLAAVLALGDNQYDSGTFNEYQAYYNNWWGVARDITEPVPGDHEYNSNPSSNAPGYFQYWGTPASGHDGYGYRDFDLPSGCHPADRVCWHVVALNSELCLLPTGCGPPRAGAEPGPGNAMYRWLKRDLRDHPNTAYGCTLAFWHHPLFTLVTGDVTTAVLPLWKLLYRAGVDVVLNANAHDYERWTPRDPSGALDRAHGIREFISGLGGVRKDPLPSVTPAALEDAQASSFGVLELTLLPTGYSWQWVTAPGQPAFTDAATTPTACH
jgi:serine/threonine protein kinase